MPVVVKNTGAYSGREVVMLYCQAPEGKLKKAARVLVAYGKTKVLAPGEEETLILSFDEKCMASFDEDAFILEKGEYNFYIGNEKVASTDISETRCIEQCENACTHA